MIDHMESMMPTRNHWPALIALLIAGFLSLSAWSFHRASRGASAVTDSDYYSHGMRFEKTLLEKKAAASLGWNMETSLNGRQLRILLKDSRQLPVTAARAELTMSGDSRGEVLRLLLAENAGGAYVVHFPATLHGELTARVDFERDGAHLSRQLILALP